MLTPNAEAILRRNRQYIDHLLDSKVKYFSYLSTMSRFHKFKADELASFALEAPPNFTATATREMWNRGFQRNLIQNAKGVTIIRDGDALTFYDVSETTAATNSQAVNLWQYNNEQHKKFLDAVVPGDMAAEQKVTRIIEELANKAQVSDNDREFVKASIAVVVLERLGLNNDEAVGKIATMPLKGRDIHAVVEQTQAVSQQFLDAMQKSVQQFAQEADVSRADNNPLFEIVDDVLTPEVAAEQNLTQEQEQTQTPAESPKIEETPASDVAATTQTAPQNEPVERVAVSPAPSVQVTQESTPAENTQGGEVRNFSLGTFTHTRTGEQIPNAVLSGGRLNRADYEQLNEIAKKHGGFYDSRYSHSFLFQRGKEQGREAFLREAEAFLARINTTTQQATEQQTAQNGGERHFSSGTFTHTRTGVQIPQAQLAGDRLDNESYRKINDIAIKHGGRYNNFSHSYLFQRGGEQGRDAFIEEAEALFTPVNVATQEAAATAANVDEQSEVNTVQAAPQAVNPAPAEVAAQNEPVQTAKEENNAQKEQMQEPKQVAEPPKVETPAADVAATAQTTVRAEDLTDEQIDNIAVAHITNTMSIWESQKLYKTGIQTDEENIANFKNKGRHFFEIYYDTTRIRAGVNRSTNESIRVIHAQGGQTVTYEIPVRELDGKNQDETRRVVQDYMLRAMVEYARAHGLPIERANGTVENHIREHEIVVSKAHYNFRQFVPSPEQKEENRRKYEELQSIIDKNDETMQNLRRVQRERQEAETGQAEEIPTHNHEEITQNDVITSTNIEKQISDVMGSYERQEILSSEAIKNLEEIRDNIYNNLSTINDGNELAQVNKIASQDIKMHMDFIVQDVMSGNQSNIDELINKRREAEKAQAANPAPAEVEQSQNAETTTQTEQTQEPEQVTEPPKAEETTAPNAEETKQDGKEIPDLPKWNEQYYVTTKGTVIPGVNNPVVTRTYRTFSGKTLAEETVNNDTNEVYERTIYDKGEENLQETTVATEETKAEETTAPNKQEQSPEEFLREHIIVGGIPDFTEKEQTKQAEETPAPKIEPDYHEIDNFQVGVDESGQLYARYVGKGYGISLNEAETNKLPYLSYQSDKWIFGIKDGVGAIGEENRREFIRRANEIINNRENQKAEEYQKQINEVMTAYENNEFEDSAEALRRLQVIRIGANSGNRVFQEGVLEGINNQLNANIKRIRKDREELFAKQEAEAEQIRAKSEQTTSQQTEETTQSSKDKWENYARENGISWKPLVQNAETRSNVAAQDSLFDIFDEPQPQEEKETTSTAVEQSAQQAETPAPDTAATAQKWDVATIPVGLDWAYQVYRIIDPTQPDNTGNREWGKVFDTKEEAEAEAAKLNGETVNIVAENTTPTPTQTAEQTAQQAETTAPDAAATVQDEPKQEESFEAILAADEAVIRGKSREKNVFRQNILAIRTLQRIEKENRPATEEEKEIIRGYAGFGGIPKAFDEGSPDWDKEAALLKSILTEDEYKSARESTLTAFYTPKEVIEGIYNGLSHIGFQNGTILEPGMGTGRFFDNMPEDMKKGSHLYGVEKDSLPGRISKILYPEAEINIKGFENSTYMNNSFDVAVGNVPFNDFGVYDPAYKKEKFLVHDYFIAKMINQVRPGGVVAVITSHGTMDKRNDFARKYFATRADLIKAVRLPNTAFKSAGTEVTSDILFFRKREEPRTPDEPYPEWVYSDEYGEEGDVRVNRYFLNHSEDVIGNLQRVSTAHGFDIACKSDESRPLAETLNQVMDSMPKVYEPIENVELPRELPEVAQKYPLSFYIEGNEIKFYDGVKSEIVQFSAGKVGMDNRKHLMLAMELRDATRNVFDVQQAKCTDEELSAAQTKLDSVYNRYVQTYGRIKDNKKLEKIFGKDQSLFLLRGLEKYDKEGNYLGKSPIFSERTIQPNIVPTHVDSNMDALAISMQQYGDVNLKYMAELTDHSEQEIISELEYSRLYFDSDKNKYVIADEYLSGDIRGKMEDLERQITDIEGEMSKTAAKNVLEIEDVPTYIPQNETEQILLQKDPKKGIAYFDFETEEKDKEYTDYIVNNADKREFLTQIAARYGVPFGTRKIFEDKPLITLESIRRGRNARHIPSGASAMASEKIIDLTLEAIKERYRFADEISQNTEHSQMIYAFMREKFKPLDGDIEKVTDFINNLRNPQKRQDLYSEWENFQADYKQKKQVFLDSDNAEIGYFKSQLVRMQKNHAALDKVKPDDLTAADIHVELGATWIPTTDIADFMKETFELPRRIQPDVKFSEISGVWKVNCQKWGLGAKAETTYGVSQFNAVQLTEMALNLKEPKIEKMVDIGGEEKPVIDLPATIAAQEKQRLIKQKFSEWIFSDEKRAERLVAYYNRYRNNIRPREYDGSDLIFPGANQEIQLRPHQKDAIAHTLYGGNTLFAHSVGAGKTFEMIASAMEAKRLGLCNKPMIIVPKHLTMQVGEDFAKLYPQANILLATDKDFEKNKRKEFCARVATQNWDVVIMGHTQFDKVKLSNERLEKNYQTKIANLEEEIQDLKENEADRFSIKQAELVKKKYENELQKVQDNNATNKDQTVTFEQLGVDRLYVDEAHLFKNLSITTKLNNVPGITTDYVARTADMYGKCMYLNEINKGKCGVVFATGTPIANSMSEFYTMQYYLQPERLRDEGVYSFDSWIANFGQVETVVELKPEGGFQRRTRFTKFHNLPELMSMFKEVADIKMPDQLNLDVPKAEKILCTIKPTEKQEEMVQALADRADAVRKRQCDPKQDNIIKIMGEGRLLALDPRLIDPSIKDEDNTKINVCVKNVLQVYHETQDKKSTQLIFCDQGVPKAGKEFNVYDDIRDKLAAQGIPREKIAFIHEANDDKAKAALFAKVRKGEVRVLIGSTGKMGVGTNVQDKLIAMHDLDCPWRPCDLEQRLGRIIRQGNENKEVKIFRYVTEKTFDAFSWQTVERKLRFINQVMTSKTPARSAEDIGETQFGAAEIKAAATGSPLLIEKNDVEMKLDRLKMVKSEYLRSHERLQSMISAFPKQIEKEETFLQDLQRDFATIKANTKVDEQGKAVFSMEMDGKTYTDRKELTEVWAKHLKEGSVLGLKGKCNGLTFQVVNDFTYHQPSIHLYGVTTDTAWVNLSKPGDNIRRILEMASVDKFEKRITKQQETVAEIKQKYEIAKREVDTPFQQEDEFKKLSARLAEITAILGIDKIGVAEGEDSAKKVAEAGLAVSQGVGR